MYSSVDGMRYLHDSVLLFLFLPPMAKVQSLMACCSKQNGKPVYPTSSLGHERGKDPSVQSDSREEIESQTWNLQRVFRRWPLSDSCQ